MLLRKLEITYYREEGVALVNKFDGEFPDKYFKEIMDYLEIDEEYFKNELTDRFRSPHLWSWDDTWKLNYNVMGTGLKDS